ncbi:Protein NUCLEAR FUSION DEFECTIVE 4 [Linum perenne]
MTKPPLPRSHKTRVLNLHSTPPDHQLHQNPPITSKTPQNMARSQLPQALNSKWFSTVASIWIQSTSGSLYTFSVYSAVLKSTQGYDQSTLDTVTVFKDIGANCAVLAGVLYSSVASDRSSQLAGPWIVHLAGAIQSFAGYFLMWTAIVGLIPPPPLSVMCLFMILAAHAQSFFNTANVVTSVRNFRTHSGTAVGIMKGFVGLSGAILIQLYQTVFDNKPESFLLMLAVLPALNSLLLMWFVRIYSRNEEDEKKHLDRFSLIAMTIAAYLLFIIITENVLSFKFVLRAIAFVLLLLLLASPLIVDVRAHKVDSMEDQFARLLPMQEDENTQTNQNRNTSLPELNLLQAISTVNFWILFLATACGMGTGLATVNNMGQLGQSLGYSTHETNTLVSLWSIWNFLGRFGGGYVSDYFLHKGGFARPLFMAITLLGMSFGHLVIASGFRGALYAGSILIGVCYGSQWSLMPSIASEIFGVNHMGTIFNTITIACPVGTYIFSVRVIGFIYDKESSGTRELCTGTHCFMMSFVIMSCATFVGCLAALWLFLRTRLFYSRAILGRLRASLRKNNVDGFSEHDETL